MTELGDFSSYDLGRVLEALRAEVAERPVAPAAHALRAACVQLLTWDHSYRTCWNDPSFMARVTWLRAALLDGTETPATDAIAKLAPLVDQLVALDALADDEPF